MSPDPYALALERADEDEQAYDLAEHYHDRGLVPPRVFKSSPGLTFAGVEGWGRLAVESAEAEVEAEAETLARNGANAPRLTGPSARPFRASGASVASRGSGPSAAGTSPSPPYVSEPGAGDAGLA